MSAGYLESLAATFAKLLAKCANSPQTRLADLDYLSDRTLRRIEAFNENGYQEEPVQRCVQDVIYKQVQLHPEKEAVCAWDGALTYRELWRHVQYMAQGLVAEGVGPETVVPLCFEKSVWTAVAMLAVMEAGAAFCPLDATQPESRLQQLVSRLGAEVLLCSRSHVQKLSSICNKIVPVDGDSFSDLSQAITTKRQERAQPSDVAYVLWTSGSTGEPKGVVIEHRAYCSSAPVQASAYGMKSDYRMFQYSSYVFDASIQEILTTLMIGGTVCVPDEHSRMNDLAGVMNRLRVNWAVLTPSVVTFLTPAMVPGLKTLLLCGEVMSQENIATWSSISLMNGYGPAECSVAATANSDVSRTREPTDIGRGIGVRTWLVDPEDHNRLMPIGCVAELCIEGPTLARGYYNDPERTRSAFIENPAWAVARGAKEGRSSRMYKTGDLVRYHTETGTLFFVGRKDSQVKLHGQRIELGEIEHHLSDESAIRQTVLAIPKSGFCKQRLVAVVSMQAIKPADQASSERHLELLDKTHQEMAQPIVATIRERLSKRLPTFMIPAIWLAVSSIPLLKSGKLDRKLVLNWVQSLSEESYSHVVQGDVYEDEPASEMESQLRSIWANVLNLRPPQVGLKKSFLQLGGDSISAMMVQSQCKKLGVVITVQDIISAKSLSHLATLAKKASAGAAKEEEKIEEDFDLSPIQTLYFQVPRGKGHFNQSCFVRVTRPVQAAQLRNAVKTIVNRHSMLRARFRLSEDDEEWKQRITTDVAGSYALQTHRCVGERDAVPLIEKSQGSLDPVSGPLMAVDLFDTQEGQLLFMTAHHLVVDLVSWRVILQDVEELLTNPTAAAADAESSLSFQTWCKLQMEHAHKQPLNKVLPPCDITIQDSVYWGMEERSNVYGDVSYEGFELDAQATSTIASGCHSTLRTDTVDILLAAMLQSFSQTFADRPPPTIFPEGHGREVWDSTHDLSRTIGWFTVMYPIFIASAASSSFLDVLRRVKDFRRAVPANGRPYFASRYLTSKGAKRLGKHWPLEITFNYLGIYQQLERQGGLLVPVEEMAGEARGAGGKADVGVDTPRFGMFEISAVIVQGRLRFSFTFNRHMRHQERIREWIGACKETLLTMPTQLAKVAPQPTLSDYPLLSMSYENLEMLTSAQFSRLGIRDVGEVEDMYRCSGIQQGLLISKQRDAAFYAIEELYQVKSHDGLPVDADRVASAWQKVVQRHAALRTIFVESLRYVVSPTNFGGA